MNDLDAISSSVCKHPSFRPCGEVAADEEVEGGVGGFEFVAFAFALFDFGEDGGGAGAPLSRWKPSFSGVDEGIEDVGTAFN